MFAVLAAVIVIHIMSNILEKLPARRISR